MTTDRPTDEMLGADYTHEQLERLVTRNPAATQRLLDDVLATGTYGDDFEHVPEPAALYGTPAAAPETEPAALGGDGDFAAWHYANAKTLLDSADPDTVGDERAAVLLAAANVHASLAVAVATREQTVALWRTR